MVRILYALKCATVIKNAQKKLQLRSQKVWKRYDMVNGVAFHGKIESEEGTEKNPVGKL